MLSFIAWLVIFNLALGALGYAVVYAMSRRHSKPREWFLASTNRVILAGTVVLILIWTSIAILQPCRKVTERDRDVSLR
jgi:Trk-type K+ transport system membrane component